MFYLPDLSCVFTYQIDNSIRVVFLGMLEVWAVFVLLVVMTALSVKQKDAIINESEPLLCYCVLYMLPFASCATTLQLGPSRFTLHGKHRSFCQCRL